MTDLDLSCRDCDENDADTKFLRLGCSCNLHELEIWKGFIRTLQVKNSAVWRNQAKCVISQF